MSLALRLFFWDDAAWAPAPPPPPPGPPPPPPAPLPGPSLDGAGGGGKKRDSDDFWNSMPTDLWDTRERYLRSLHPEPPNPAPLPDGPDPEAIRRYEERQQQIEQATADRSAAISALRSAETLDAMKTEGARITTLTARIAELTGKQTFARFMKH